MRKSSGSGMLPREGRWRLHHGERRAICVVVALIMVMIPLSAAAQEGDHAPAPPSDVKAVHVTFSDGTTGIRLRWIDNAGNELGFKAVDQRTGQEYDVLPSTGPTGAVVTLTIPLASGCFRVFAYNNDGASPMSDLACTPELLPATGDDGARATLPVIALVVAMLGVAAGMWTRQRVTARNKT